MVKTPFEPGSAYGALFALIVTMLQFGAACADSFPVPLADGNEINVERSHAAGELLMIWIIDHEEQRPQFEQMLSAINASGVEIWRIDPLADYFLPRTNENARTLSGEGVAAVIETAYQSSDKLILLAAYDRMPLPLLRGIRLWSQNSQEEQRMLGSILYYPNLFGPPPLAGHEPELDPVVAASNYPLVVVQPSLGSQRWRLQQVLETLWDNGAPAHALLLPGIRDWFFMHQPGKNPLEDKATELIPAQIKQLSRVLQAAAKPKSTLTMSEPTPTAAPAQELVPFSSARAAPRLDLPDSRGEHSFDGFNGKVTLVSFWATWCPPCVEEVPSLNRLQARYASRPFNLISVDFRESVEEIEAFNRRIRVEFPILMDLDGRVSLDWGVFSFPSSFLIDHRGVIRYSINRAIDWDTPEVHAIIDTLLTDVGRARTN